MSMLSYSRIFNHIYVNCLFQTFFTYSCTIYTIRKNTAKIFALHLKLTQQKNLNEINLNSRIGKRYLLLS